MNSKKPKLSQIVNNIHDFYVNNKIKLDNLILTSGGTLGGAEAVSKIMKTDYVQGLETFLIASLYSNLITDNFGKNSKVAKVLDKIENWSYNNQLGKSQKNLLRKSLKGLQTISENGSNFFKNKNVEKGALLTGASGFVPLIHYILNGTNSNESMIENAPTYLITLLASYGISKLARKGVSITEEKIKEKPKRSRFKTALTLVAAAYLSFSGINHLTENNIITKRLKSDPKKKTFFYSQEIGDSDIEEDLKTYADYQMPHMFKFQKKDNNEIGFLQVYRDNTIVNYVQTQHKHKSKVLPMVSAFNKDVLKKILLNPNDFTDLISERVKNLGLDGILIDFESIGVKSNYSDDLNKFMKLLREKLPEKKYEIGIAVSPRFQGSERKGFSHHGLYEFNGLSKHVDQMHIMAYDFHKGVFGPVLPEDKLNKLIEYALENIPKEKIVLSLPFYGYVWNDQKKPIGTLSCKYNNNYLTDADSVFIDNGELRIEKGDRIVYTQNDEVFKKRFELLEKNKIRKVAGWKVKHMGNETNRSLKNWKKKVERRYTQTKHRTQKNYDKH